MRHWGHPDHDAPEFHLSTRPLGHARRSATRAELRLIERYLFEPGYAMAYLFLSARLKSRLNTAGGSACLTTETPGPAGPEMVGNAGEAA